MPKSTPLLGRVPRRVRSGALRVLGRSTAGVGLSLPAPGRQIFDAGWYLEAYPDVREARVNPLRHFLTTGAREGRRPNPLFWTDWYATQYLDPGEATDPFRHYLEIGQHERLRFNPIDDPSFISEAYGLGPSDDPLRFLLSHPDIDRVSVWFSRKTYREYNPDVAAAEVIPEVHFLAWGLQQQRLCGSDYFVSSRPIPSPAYVATRDLGEGVVEEFVWSGSIHRVTASLISSDVIEQVLAQAEIDPSVVAAGFKSVAGLRQRVATDVEAQVSVDYQQLLDEVPIGQDAVIILPEVRLGGAEKYAANLAWGLKQVGMQDVLIATTDGTRASDARCLALESFAPIRDLKVASLGESLGRSATAETVLAHLLLRAAPKHVFVVNSWTGLQMISLHGRALSTRMHLATTFFCEAPYAFGTPLSALFLRDVLPYATVLSDNQTTLRAFVERVGPTFEDRFRALYTTVALSDGEAFERTLDKRAVQRDREPRALWLSRWDTFQKAVDVLERFAELEPRCTIDAFGPGSPSSSDSPTPRNIRRMGQVAGPSSIPLQDYDVFIFTSYFEGMPNVVLEMAAAGIPIIASDVGGLRETFTSEALELVPMAGSVDDSAMGFRDALARVTAQTAETRIARLRTARHQVEVQHGREAFLAGLAGYLEESH